MTPHAGYISYIVAAYLISGVTLALMVATIWRHYRKILNQIQNLANK